MKYFNPTFYYKGLKYQRGSISAYPSAIAAAQAAGQQFSPTNNGQISSNGDLVYAFGDDSRTGGATSTADSVAGIWTIVTSTNCYIRVGGTASGNFTGTDVAWYNTSGVDQGDPGSHTGTGTTVFTLGEVPDSMTITHLSLITISGTPTFGNIDSGQSYTSGVEITSITQDAKYGRKVTCDSTSTNGFDNEEGDYDIKFTFSKTGYVDYNITYTGHGRTRAYSEP